MNQVYFLYPFSKLLHTSRLSILQFTSFQGDANFVIKLSGVDISNKKEAPSGRPVAFSLFSQIWNLLSQNRTLTAVVNNSSWNLVL